MSLPVQHQLCTFLPNPLLPLPMHYSLPPPAPPPQVAHLTANLSFVADFGWSTTAVKSVNVSYAVIDAQQKVNPEGWDKAIDWVVRQAGARLALSQIWEQYVKTPVAPFFSLENVVTGSAGDRWRGLSADVRLTREW